MTDQVVDHNEVSVEIASEPQRQLDKILENLITIIKTSNNQNITNMDIEIKILLRIYLKWLTNNYVNKTVYTTKSINRIKDLQEYIPSNEISIDDDYLNELFNAINFIIADINRNNTSVIVSSSVGRGVSNVYNKMFGKNGVNSSSGGGNWFSSKTSVTPNVPTANTTNKLTKEEVDKYKDTNERNNQDIITKFYKNKIWKCSLKLTTLSPLNLNNYRHFFGFKDINDNNDLIEPTEENFLVYGEYTPIKSTGTLTLGESTKKYTRYGNIPIKSILEKYKIKNESLYWTKVTSVADIGDETIWFLSFKSGIFGGHYIKKTRIARKTISKLRNNRKSRKLRK